ncbi:MAG: sulfatase-like hydrolase/transferase [Dehalococcoidia bacterium]
MKQRLKNIFKGPVVFYPLLFAVFPILFLYVHNISQTSASELFLPIVISVAATLVLWAILSLGLGSLARAGFATAIFLVLFFAYGRFYDVLVDWGSMPRHAYLLPSMLFIWGYSVYFIGRARRDFHVTTRWLNVTAVVLVAINLFNVANYQVHLARSSDGVLEDSAEQIAVAPADPITLPDVYFIILDEYAHPDTMKEYYDYDNSKFITSLEDKGFFIASDSKTRTPNSSEVMASVLNMQYVTEAHYWDETRRTYVEGTSGEAKDFDDVPWTKMLHQMIGHNNVAEFLMGQGYQYIVFGNWYTVGRYDHYMKESADLYFNYCESGGSTMVTEFADILWNTTMLRPFYHHITGSQYEIYHRSGVLNTLEHLRKVPDIEGPKFIFVHFMCPHSPYVFGSDAEFVAPANWKNHKDGQYYRGQYIFISREIEKVVETLLEESDIPPIIILQSDHGLRPHHTGIGVGPDEWEKILNAMYLPGLDYGELPDSISPVNTFRLIFNHYFNADYPLLEND